MQIFTLTEANSPPRRVLKASATSSSPPKMLSRSVTIQKKEAPSVSVLSGLRSDEILRDRATSSQRAKTSRISYADNALLVLVIDVFILDYRFDPTYMQRYSRAVYTAGCDQVFSLHIALFTPLTAVRAFHQRHFAYAVFKIELRTFNHVDMMMIISEKQEFSFDCFNFAKFSLTACFT